MSRPKKKPSYNAGRESKKVLEEVSAYYKSLLDEPGTAGSITGGSNTYRMIVLTAEKFNMTPVKIRKLLITAGLYKTETSELIAKLHTQGKSALEIQQITGLNRASINAYLPYSKTVYKNTESSAGAERVSLYRKRRKACVEFQEMLLNYKRRLDCNDNAAQNMTVELEQALWELILLFEGYTFQTAKGLKFHYTVKGGELFISRRENSKSLTKSSVLMAFQTGVKLQNQDGYIKGPKKLGTFGASYLYPMFIRFGIITDKPVDKQGTGHIAAD